MVDFEPIRETDKNRIIEFLSGISLSGYAWTTDNLWDAVKEEFPEPDLLLAQGIDVYAIYRGKGDAWGEYLIRQKDRILVILGCNEYFSKAIFTVGKK